jgi:hypothetical protein
VGAGRGIAEEDDELLLDVGGDRVLPAGGLLVDLLPLEPDHVDEQSLGEAVTPHHRGGELPTLRGEAQRSVVEQFGVAGVDQAVHGLGDARGRHPESLHEPGPDGQHALLLEFEDRLEVLLGGVVQFGHGPGRVLTRLRPRPMAAACGDDQGLRR